MALRFKAKKATGKHIVKSIELVHQVLKDLSRQENTLDSNLADYAFFPLSIIFRESKELPIRAVEAALNCLRILISYGWRIHISADLGKQLLILLSFLAGGNHGEENGKEVSEELAIAAFECFESLFDSAENAGLGSPKSVGSENVPVLGHAISIVLDGIAKGPSAAVKAAALRALNSIIKSIDDVEVLRRFVPGIISSLTKSIRPGSGSGVPYKNLRLSLEILERLLNKVISDPTGELSSKISQSDQTNTSKEQQQVGAWAQASSGQVKLALANIIPLQYHERFEVRRSFFNLSMSILQNCRTSLSQSIPMLTETLLVICAQRNSPDASELLNQAMTAILHDPDILEIVKSSLHDWIVALPRIMQSSDDAPKERGIARVSTALEIISARNMISNILENAVSLNLRSSVLTAIQTDKSVVVHPISEGSFEVAKMLQSSDSGRGLLTFRPVLFAASSQKSTLDGLRTLAKQLQVLPMSNNFQQGVLENLRKTSGDEQLANLWLSLQLLNNETSEETHEMDQYLNLPSNENTFTPIIDDVYSFALDVLSEPSFEKQSTNWRLQALSLEVIALQAKLQKQDFRPELVDALYPILERMGSSNAALQNHAVICLNLVSTYCAYPSAGALVVANADYLVNAVALKLNTFEVSPQAPLVLVMMIKSCGPALVPYLDDLVETIFTILACFHGYPRLVESLFSVLHAIVEETGKSSHKAIESSPFAPRRQPVYQPLTIAALAERLKERRFATSFSSPPASTQIPHSPPDSPGGSPRSPPLESSNPAPEAEDPAPPPSIALLLSIATQTQNHLSSPSPALILSLISLLSHAFPSLTPYQDKLLPLIATMFPLLIIHLHSPSPQISIAASTALTAACEAGGDFLASKIHDEWAGITKTCKKWEMEMRNEERIMGKARRVRGIKTRAWEALTTFIVAVVEWAGLAAAEMEDDIFDLLGEFALESLEIGKSALGEDEGAGAQKEEGEEKSQANNNNKNNSDIITKSNPSPSPTTSPSGNEDPHHHHHHLHPPHQHDEHKTTLLTCLRNLNPDTLWLIETQRVHHHHHHHHHGAAAAGPRSSSSQSQSQSKSKEPIRLVPPDLDLELYYSETETETESEGGEEEGGEGGEGGEEEGGEGEGETQEGEEQEQGEGQGEGEGEGEGEEQGDGQGKKKKSKEKKKKKIVLKELWL